MAVHVSSASDLRFMLSLSTHERTILALRRAQGEDRGNIETQYG
jgi:hypothetical protein